jgi:hypothetical protein
MLVSSIDKDRLFRGHACSIVITDCDKIKGKKLSSLNHYWNNTIACHRDLSKDLNSISVQTNRYNTGWIDKMMHDIIAVSNIPHNESISYSFDYSYKDEHDRNITIQFYISDFGWSYVSSTTDYLDCYEFYSSNRINISVIKQARINHKIISELIKENQEEFIHEASISKEKLLDHHRYELKCSIKPSGLADVLSCNDTFKLKSIG